MAFTAQIPVKSYIKAYLENNCGSPCDLTKLPEISDFFIGCLKYSRFQNDKQIKCNYSDRVEIIVQSDLFYRFGFLLSKTDTVQFNNKCELFLKFNARQYIMAHNSLGMLVTQCIRNFQEEFNFTEDQFSYATIRKDFDRHGSKISIKFVEDYREQLNNIFLATLTLFGTIHKSAKK
jgi:hypothetical protein